VNRPHPMSLSREFALQFLYQCETEKVFYFSDSHFERFVVNFEVPGYCISHARRLASGTLHDLDKIDKVIVSFSQNWGLNRMAATDRSMLRIATYELMSEETPVKVILNEAIDLARKYGTDQSGAFVNGLLDRIAASLDRK